MKSQRWKDIMDFSVREKRGILVLLSVLIIVILLRVWNPWNHSESKVDFSEYEMEIDEFETGLSLKQEALKKEHYTGKYKKQDAETNFDFNAEKFVFNPNLVSSSQMRDLGFSDKLINDVINYRKAGGQFFVKSDLKKMYRMNDAFFKEISQYIDLPDDRERSIRNYETFAFNPNTIGEDSLLLLGFTKELSSRWVKYRAVSGGFSSVEDVLQLYGVDSLKVAELTPYMVFDEKKEKAVSLSEEVSHIKINSCEYRDLISLQGVSGKIASRILSYRKILGGYYSADQLNEVYDMDEETYLFLKDRLEIDLSEINTIDINTGSFKELIGHPYLEKENVKAILRYREYQGGLKNLEELKRNNILPDSTYQKIYYYLSIN